MKITILWGVMPYGLIDHHHHHWRNKTALFEPWPSSEGSARFIWFSLLWISQQSFFFFKARSSALHQSDRYLPIFQRNLLPPSSEIE
jgi:hypothetical protein